MVNSVLFSGTKGVFVYVGNSMQMQCYLEKLNVKSFNLWTRNRGQKTLSHTEEQSKMSGESG